MMNTCYKHSYTEIHYIIKDFKSTLYSFMFQIMQKLQKEGKSVALRSQDDKLITGLNIYIVDTLGQ